MASGKRTILIQLDTDPHPSTFDRVVAVDAGAEQIFSYGQVTPENVVPLVHGAMFTRGPADLKSTAFFIGGSDVAAAEAVLEAVTRTFFGPLRCSVLFDPNGANTTAAAAVLSARRHLHKAELPAVVIGTGAVGQRIARLLARQGTPVYLASRRRDRAEEVCQRLAAQLGAGAVQPLEWSAAGRATLGQAPALVFAAAAAGARVVDQSLFEPPQRPRVMIDLNAVPPSGIEGIEPSHAGVEMGGTVCYGALGVGGLKMKIHRAALAQLFAANDQILDAEQVFEVGRAFVG